MQQGEVLACRLYWPGEMVAGEVHSARLTAKYSGMRRGVATLDDGREVLVDHLPAKANEGLAGSLRISRAAIAEKGRLKRPQARWLENGQPENQAQSGGSLPDGEIVRNFETGAWEEVWHAASSGSIAFAGGEILCSVTPAMTVIDIDGNLPPRELALAAIPAIAKAIQWFGLAGNLGIDFPTLEAKADRKAVDEALENALAGWLHERTAMNGFGFVQLISRLEGPSLLHRFAASRTAMCARYALRVAERTQGAGITELTIHPALKAKLKPRWLEELQRRTGREVLIETNPGLALEAPSAQVVPA